MTIQDEIQKAIGIHGQWKQRLRLAVDTGKSEFTPSVVCQDNQCDFGKWLYSLDQPTKLSERWKCVRAAHAEFHKEASQVLALGLAGKKKEAEEQLSMTSKFSTISSKLTIEMMTWKKETSKT